MGLNDEYNAIKTQILSSKTLPALGIAYHLVSQDEQQRTVDMARHPGGQASTFQTSKTASKPYGKGNLQNPNKKKNDDCWCTHCQKAGHTVDGCFELIGYPEWWNPKSTKPQSNKPKVPPKVSDVMTDNSITLGITK